jgi:hypothetical protein
MAKTAGRQVEIGIGIEVTPGTAVATADYFKWDSFSFQGMSDKTELKSARGIRNKISNSMVIREYGKGTIEFVPTVDILPYIMGMVLGTRSSGAHSGESVVYDHTFTVQNANASMKTATLKVAQGAAQTELYTNVVADSFDISVEKDFAKVKVGLIGSFPSTSSMSSSYTQDTLFTRNQMNATFGTTVANAIATAAVGTLTTTGVFSDGEIVTIGNITYTMRTALSLGGTIPYEVLIGAAATNSLDNLRSAINVLSGAGTTYGTGTSAHSQVIATTKTASTLLVKAIIAGTAGNSIATTKTAANASWGAATLASGAGNNATPLVAFSLTINNNVLFDDAFLSGAATPVVGGFIAGPLDIKGSYTLQFSDTAELAKYQQNTNSAMVVNFVGAALGTVPTNELIQFKIGRLVLTKAPIEYQLDGIILLKQEFDVQYDATDHELTCVIQNGYVGTNYQ